jgi:tRNA threonylcarbamoyladenosine biosynthesis protein TsaE
MKFVCKNEEDLEKVAQKLLEMAEEFRANSENSDKAFVVGLNGDLGSGKTTFTKKLVALAGSDEDVTSPTFVIQKNFEIDFAGYKKLSHFDAYRLGSGKELQVLGFDELILNPENMILIEWSEIVADVLPTETVQMKFTFVDDITREIEIIEN